MLYVQVGHNIRHNRNVLFLKILTEKFPQPNQGIAGKKTVEFPACVLVYPDDGRCDVAITDELLFFKT